MQQYLYLVQCFFGYGAASFLGTILIQSINEGKILKSWLTEIVQTLFSGMVIATIALHSKEHLPIFVMALGGATGTAIAMYWRKKRKRRQEEKKASGRL